MPVHRRHGPEFGYVGTRRESLSTRTCENDASHGIVIPYFDETGFEFDEDFSAERV
jgi:hypothetical protein